MYPLGSGLLKASQTPLIISKRAKSWKSLNGKPRGSSVPLGTGGAGLGGLWCEE